VAANRARLRELLGLAAEPAWLNQVHSATVINLDSGVPASPPTADAAITSRAGVACVVMVADCLPVLLTTHDGSRIGAAHAGWRGLASGVIEQAVRALGKPGRELRAWLGPCISREYFEVGDEVREAFMSQDSGVSVYFDRNVRGRWQADLVGLATFRLGQMGVADITSSSSCTFADREKFYSHRRDGKGGRLAALIWRQ
jgi:YfiH family protein